MGFFSNFLQQSPSAAACVLPETHAVVRQVVSVLGFDVVSSPAYGATLAPAINAAVDYFDKQITAIPGPLDISVAHYTHHPLVHALFAARQDIAHGIGRSMDVKQSMAFLAGADQPEAFALLGVRRQPESQQADGGALFCEHTLRSLAASEAGARQGLRTAALMRLVTGFGEHMDKLRNRIQLPRSEWNIENRTDLTPADGDAEKLVLASEELRPENLLRGLVAWLQSPARHLQVHVDGKPGGGQIESLPGLQTRDRRRWLVCLVRFPTAEGVAAIQNETRQYRYIRV